MPTRTVRGSICLAALVFLSAGISRAQEEAGVAWEEQELTGRVVDAEGHPIAGVEIWRPAEGGEDRPAAVSGPDGLFSIRAAGMYPLSACPPGWLPDESPSLAPREPGVFEIRLRPAARIAGRVVDGEGEPVEGVHVEARLAGKSIGCAVYSPPGCPGPTYLRTGETDADGRFVFESLEPGWFEVSASDGLPKVVRRLGEAGASAEEITFVSEKLVPLEGRVVDAAGEPVEGARVSVSGARPRAEGRTGADGAYRFPRVLTGPQRFEARHPDLGRIVERVQVAGPRVRFDIRMPPATLVQGRILNRDGSPVAEPSLRVDDETVELDAEGRFRFSLSPGEHAVRAEAPGRAPESRRVTATGEPIDLDFELSRPATITGRIAGLAPRQLVSVELKERFEKPWEREDVDGEGRFQILEAAPGTWTLLATDSFGRTLEHQVEVAEGREIKLGELRFPALPAVRGRLLDPEGRPVRDAHLSFEQGERLRVWAATDAEGRFTAPLVDGTWTLKAERPGFGPAAATFTLEGVALDGAPVEVPDLRLVRGVAVSGSIAGLAPGEVPFLRATSEDGAWTRGARAKLDGTFLIPDLGPGTWTVTVRLDERESSTQVRILPHDEAVRVDLVLED